MTVAAGYSCEIYGYFLIKNTKKALVEIENPL